MSDSRKAAIRFAAPTQVIELSGMSVERETVVHCHSPFVNRSEERRSILRVLELRGRCSIDSVREGQIVVICAPSDPSKPRSFWDGVGNEDTPKDVVSHLIDAFVFDQRLQADDELVESSLNLTRSDGWVFI